ncbi:SH2 domain-containing protein 6-like isoform X2 [Palaemon carinicauda]|uniref:SH2 domain-containing protein 6-like isoform X2 n=1 Tax=Palaemon carinicauda TaxID=392227 RepID=UPI0035B69BAF
MASSQAYRKGFQSRQLSDQSRSLPGFQCNPLASSDQELDNFDGDDSFSSDECDSDVETESKSLHHSQLHAGNGTNYQDSLSEDLYLTSISEPNNQSLSSSSKPQVPAKPVCLPRKPCEHPEKRKKMPLPVPTGNQAPGLPPRPGQKALPSVISKRGPAPIQTSGEGHRHIPVLPITPKSTVNVPLKHTSIDWPPKKLSEHSANQNSEGRLKNPYEPSPPVEDTDNAYEVVENPHGTSMEIEGHTTTSYGFSSSQDPPPLPRRNQDGRDGNRTWPGLPQTSSTTSSTPSKPHPSSKQMTRTLAQGSNSPVRNKPLVKLPTNSSAASLLAQYEEPSPQFKSDAPSEKAPKPPPQLSDLSNDKRFQILPSCVERVNIGDGESIELSPLYRRLIDRPYFHVISRSKSKKSLEKAADGVFLIRPSTRSSDPLTLCLQYCGRTYNINIRKRNDGHYALGTEKVNEMTFKSIDELVSTYSKEPIKLQNGDRVRLKGSPAKEDHIYVRMPIPVQNNY